MSEPEDLPRPASPDDFAQTPGGPRLAALDRAVGTYVNAHENLRSWSLAAYRDGSSRELWLFLPHPYGATNDERPRAGVYLTVAASGTVKPPVVVGLPGVIAKPIVEEMHRIVQTLK
jgi:hypothetical protein